MPAMTRVPNTDSLWRLLGWGEDQTLHVVSRAPIKEQMAVLVAIERQRPYQWTTDDDEIAEDAIMVGIGGTSATMISAGLSYVEPQASIYWAAQTTSKGFFAAGEHMGWPVPEALDRAHELRIMMNARRVVITIEEVGMWRNEWGKLLDREGFDW